MGKNAERSLFVITVGRKVTNGVIHTVNLNLNFKNQLSHTLTVSSLKHNISGNRLRN